MRVTLSTEELTIIVVALEQITIKGKDSFVIGNLLTKITKSFQTAKIKEEGNGIKTVSDSI